LFDVSSAATGASTLDDIHTRVGQFGSYQKRVVVAVAFISFSTAFNNLGYVFWAAPPDFHCVPDDSLTAALVNYGRHSNATLNDERLLNLTVPWEHGATAGQYRRSRLFTYLPVNVSSQSAVYYASAKSE